MKYATIALTMLATVAVSTASVSTASAQTRLPPGSVFCANLDRTMAMNSDSCRGGVGGVRNPTYGNRIYGNNRQQGSYGNARSQFSYGQQASQRQQFHTETRVTHRRYVVASAPSGAGVIQQGRPMVAPQAARLQDVPLNMPKADPKALQQAAIASFGAPAAGVGYHFNVAANADQAPAANCTIAGRTTTPDGMYTITRRVCTH